MRPGVGGFIVLLGRISLLNLCGAEPTANKLPPVDETSSDPALKAFRDKLLATIQKRDKTSLISVLAAGIKNDFGGGADGVEGFARQWRINQPDSKVWQVLSDVLILGGTFTGPKTFCAPYVYSKFPDTLDAFGYEVIIRESAALLVQPSATAAVIQTLSYDIVEVDYDRSVRDAGQANYKWLKVTAPSGQTGYLARADLRSPIDYRACFDKLDGAWKMVMLVAGD